MKKWICIGLFLIGTCSVQAQDLVSDFLAKTKENKVFTQVNISSRMFQMISEITDAETESIIRNLTGMKMLTRTGNRPVFSGSTDDASEAKA